MQDTESNHAYFQSAVRHHGYLGPQSPRQPVLTARVTMAREQPEACDPEVVSHWLAEFAARAQFDALRHEQLQV
jgi:hypothetical protein